MRGAFADGEGMAETAFSSPKPVVDGIDGWPLAIRGEEVDEERSELVVGGGVLEVEGELLGDGCGRNRVLSLSRRS